ncbi:MAG: prepilin peptidase [Verrucomicrobia bacterium]|nr:prepilin peptidase [Verrucomicrobiota bacterium]
MSRYELLNAFLHFLFFFMGAGIGSFLNVVIYRLPRGMSVNQPRRSFCPTCKNQIPMWLNIPLVSWIMLRGKCAKCDSAISPRYLGVELLTGLLFYAVFWKVGGDWAAFKQWGPVMLCLWIFVSLLVSGSFIDIEHFILPHEITIGGTVIGLISATLVPSLVGEDMHLRGFLISLASAALGLGGLWLVVELGKLAFGRKKYRFEKAAAWSVTQPNEEEPPVVTLAGEAYGWGDIYSRASDRMIITCAALRANEQTWENVTAELWMEKLKVRSADGKLEEFALEGVTKLEGTTTEVVIPREAMGFGDVLLLMMIGSFLGWKAVLFTVLAASIFGTVIAGLARLIGRSEWGAKIPFGPYLAAGALGWLFYGQEVLTWYMGLMSRGQVEAVW